MQDVIQETARHVFICKQCSNDNAFKSQKSKPERPGLVTGGFLRMRRKSTGIDTGYMARQLGLADKASLYGWERGKNLPNLADRPRLCELLQITHAELQVFIDIDEARLARKAS